MTTESRATRAPAGSKVATHSLLGQTAASAAQSRLLSPRRSGCRDLLSIRRYGCPGTERLVTEAGRKALLLPGDIGDHSVSQDVARKAIDAFGVIDILVNNAAFQRTYGKFEDIPDDEFEETFRVNVFAMFRLCKAILPQMKEGGSIINTGSIQSFDPSENLIAYAATKSAIVSFTRSLASLAIKQGVRVNAVAPGPVWTPLIPSTMPKEKVKNFGANTVFGRAAQPAEMPPSSSSLPATKPAMSPGKFTAPPEARCLSDLRKSMLRCAVGLCFGVHRVKAGGRAHFVTRKSQYPTHQVSDFQLG